MPGREELPSTLRRSSKEAQDTWIKTHDSAVEEYGEGQRSHRTAYASLKHKFEKVGDHWEKKPKKGPSDPQAAKGTPASRTNPSRTAGGVDANASKEHLMKIAQELDVKGRSSMNKGDLVKAIEKANTRATAKSRERDKGKGRKS
ncbi:ChaB family protein [Bailinhaonella thermotolerans]|uniref:Cation transport regulator ChaB n=1 Tax=Bailinhaonella thermotolerans TaxID=1070861 RepID=A0A3A4AY87_9ACTN|nr:ChaB family protein [Bailinhaonella thermotolerans]RJL32466.1 cation transport regulator ChaB [Bailinhaonella thermotolerans]